MKSSVKRHTVVQPQDQSIRIIPLTQGMVSLVDSTDYDWLMQWAWYAHEGQSGIYAENWKLGKMHRFILNFPNGDVDHRNGNTLDNRRCNLRSCSRSQNQANRRRGRNNTSGYKGVSWDQSINRWVADLRVNGKHIRVGSFENIHKAAKAYDEVAQRYFGNFAHLNFPNY